MLSLLKEYKKIIIVLLVIYNCQGKNDLIKKAELDESNNDFVKLEELDESDEEITTLNECFDNDDYITVFKIQDKTENENKKIKKYEKQQIEGKGYLENEGTLEGDKTTYEAQEDVQNQDDEGISSSSTKISRKEIESIKENKKINKISSFRFKTCNLLCLCLGIISGFTLNYYLDKQNTKELIEQTQDKSGHIFKNESIPQIAPFNDPSTKELIEQTQDKSGHIFKNESSPTIATLGNSNFVIAYRNDDGQIVVQEYSDNGTFIELF